MFDPTISEKVKNTKRQKYGKKVAEINNGNIIQIWNSIVEAAENTGLDRFKISMVCNGKRLTTGNKVFRFLDDNNQIIEPEIKTNKTEYNKITKNCKKINVYDLNLNLLNTFNSIALAA